jgi:hypothetical protein
MLRPDTTGSHRPGTDWGPADGGNFDEGVAQVHRGNAFQMPESITAKVEEIMSARRGWSGPIGMSMTQGATEGGDQGGDGGQGGSLLEDEAGQHDGGGDEGGDEGGDGGDQGGQQFDPNAFEQRIESMLDRRINQVVSTLTRRLGGDSGGQGGDGDQGGQQGGQQDGQQQQTRVSGPSAADLREGRMVYRESCGVKWLDNAERDHAATLAGHLVTQRIAAGDDPEQAGRTAAREVESTIKSLRSLYEKKTVSALQRKGLLPPDGRGPGQPVRQGSTGKVGDTSSYQAGASKAQQLYADRLPQGQSS